MTNADIEVEMFNLSVLIRSFSFSISKFPIHTSSWTIIVKSKEFLFIMWCLLMIAWLVAQLHPINSYESYSKFVFRYGTICRLAKVSLFQDIPCQKLLKSISLRKTAMISITRTWTMILWRITYWNILIGLKRSLFLLQTIPINNNLLINPFQHFLFHFVRHFLRSRHPSINL